MHPSPSPSPSPCINLWTFLSWACRFKVRELVQLEDGENQKVYCQRVVFGMPIIDDHFQISYSIQASPNKYTVIIANYSQLLHSKHMTLHIHSMHDIGVLDIYSLLSSHTRLSCQPLQLDAL